jgi:hypothetical protein
MTSTDPAIATNQEPEPLSMLAEPPALPAAPAENPGSGNVTAQRQMARNSPQTPQKRRLGLGAPLSGPPGDSPARAAPVSDQPVVARLARSSASRDAGGTTPHRPVPSEPGSEAAQEQSAAASGDPPAVSAGWPTRSAEAPEPAQAATASVQPALTDQARPHDLGPPGSVPPGPVPAEAAAPVEKPLAEAPLIGELPPALPAVRPSITQPATAVPPRTTPLPAETPLATTAAPLPSAARATVQRSVASSGASPGNPAARSPAPVSVPPPPADPGLKFASLTPDPRPADQSAWPPDRLPIAARRLPSDSPIETILPRRAEVAPLLGHRPPARLLDALSGARAGPQPSPASMIPDTPRGTPVQRSVHPRSPVSRLDGPAGVVAGGQAADRREPTAGYVDPGTIAVARGLARRDPDGSVVFDLSPSPVLPDPSPLPLPRHDESAGWHTATGPLGTVQRQEAAAGPADAPAPSSDSGLTTATMAAPSAAPAPAPSATSATPPTPGAASPSLDELARQLFGPLTARLKAELRLDRERAGLLTDLRQ